MASLQTGKDVRGGPLSPVEGLAIAGQSKTQSSHVNSWIFQIKVESDKFFLVIDIPTMKCLYSFLLHN
jgi:hypothetical protein